MRDLYCTDRLAESSSLACVTAVSLLPRVRRAYVQRLVGFELSHHPEFTIAMTLGSKLLLREVQCRRGIALLSMRPRVRAIHCCILVREDTMTASGPQNTKLLGGKLCEAMAACYENPSSASAATANGADGNGARLQSAAAVSSTPVQGSTVLMAHRGSDAPLRSEKLAVHVSVNSPDLVAVSQRSGPSADRRHSAQPPLPGRAVPVAGANAVPPAVATAGRSEWRASLGRSSGNDVHRLEQIGVAGDMLTHGQSLLDGMDDCDMEDFDPYDEDAHVSAPGPRPRPQRPFRIDAFARQHDECADWYHCAAPRQRHTRAKRLPIGHARRLRLSQPGLSRPTCRRCSRRRTRLWPALNAVDRLARPSWSRSGSSVMRLHQQAMGPSGALRPLPPPFPAARQPTASSALALTVPSRRHKPMGRWLARRPKTLRWRCDLPASPARAGAICLPRRRGPVRSACLAGAGRCGPIRGKSTSRTGGATATPVCLGAQQGLRLACIS
jgi:hypothetical protein